MFSSPPTHELRKEWRQLDTDRKRKLIEMSLNAPRRIDDGPEVRRHFEELGVSPSMVDWLLEEAVRQQEEFRQSVVTSSVKTPIDRFNTALGFTVTLMVGLLWWLQDLALFQKTSFPIGFFLASVFNLLLLILAIAAWRKWLISVRSRD